MQLTIIFGLPPGDAVSAGPALPIITLSETGVCRCLESLVDDALPKERRIGLTGTAVSDYPDMVPLCRRILDQHGGVSMSSLRVDAVRPLSSSA